MLKRDLRHIKNLAMNRVTWSLVWLCFLFGFALPHIGACVGHKQRKRLADDAAGVDPPLPKPKLQPRDGHKQRKVDHDGGDPEPSVDTADGSSSSAWRRDLRGDWAKGRLTTEQVQRYAMHSMEAGADGVSDFARMGNWGATPRICSVQCEMLWGIQLGRLRWHGMKYQRKRALGHHIPSFCRTIFSLRFTTHGPKMTFENTLLAPSARVANSGNRCGTLRLSVSIQI